MITKSLTVAISLLVLSSFGFAQEYLDEESGEKPIHYVGLKAPMRLNPNIKLWLTVNARRMLEVSWKNAPVRRGDHIIITTQQPWSFKKEKLVSGTILAPFDTVEGSGSNGNEGSGVVIPADGYTTTTERIPIAPFDMEGSGGGPHYRDTRNKTNEPFHWIADDESNKILAAFEPKTSEEWIVTGIPYDFELSKKITKDTQCYGYFVSYIDRNGLIQSVSCTRAHPRWMQAMNSSIGNARIRDLFIVGTHDSGSYRTNFDPLESETLISKYSLCQDEDIWSQLMHGVRYLDIRVGYYKESDEHFFIYHGITRQRSLQEVINQVRDFVRETNEIVVFGLKEFPVGFGRNLAIHRLLVEYLREQFNELIVHPSLTWRGTLNDMWRRGQNIILAYDKPAVVEEYPQLLFTSVEQRWGNKQTWRGLETYLRSLNNVDVRRLTSRPFSDMAELTPQTFDVLLDRLGGLRKLSDQINWRISKLYRDELGPHANIVSADFYRGTTLLETSMELNNRRLYTYD